MPKSLTQKNQYDLIVIGSGPGGQRAAVQAAKLKKSALVIEKNALGGSCLHTGTVPSKTLREAALTPHVVVHDPIRSVMKRKEAVIRDEMGVISTQLKRNGVEFAAGEAKFHSAHEVVIGDSTPIRGDYIVIATGTAPHRPSNLRFDNETLFDSDTILNVQHLPASLAIIGSGVIGCEYASIFAKLGIQVSLYDRRETLFQFVDREITEALRQQFISSHINLQLGAEIKEIKHANHPETNKPGIEIITSKSKAFFEAALYCMGRTGNTKNLNLIAANLTADDRGLIKVNKAYQTDVPHIYAVGDVIGNPALAASSSEQGRLAALHAFKMPSAGFPESFPYGIYTIPEISSVGMQEEDLKKNGIDYVVGRALYKELARGKILEDENGFLKLLVDKKTRKLLGIHVLGTGATELIHIGQIVRELNADVDFLVNNVFNYPTLAEAYKVAALHAVNQLRA